MMGAAQLRPGKVYLFKFASNRLSAGWQRFRPFPVRSELALSTEAWGRSIDPDTDLGHIFVIPSERALFRDCR